MADSCHVDRNSSGERRASAVDHAIAMLAWRQWGGEIEVTTPTARRNRPGVHYFRSSVESLDRTEHRGIPVTTVARTLLDLGAVDARRVSRALEQAEVLQLLDVREL